ncbi:hypothetical protein LP7551_03969 [Roseibium album]|nr:hypothetical protein LP7551_03969 [Roseibium album]
MTKTVMILSALATYGGAGMIAEEFRRRGGWDVKLVVAEKDEPQGFWEKFDAILWSKQNWFQRRAIRKLSRQTDLTILAGTPALDIWLRVLSGKASRRPGKKSFSAKFVKKNATISEKLPSQSTACLLVTDSYLLNDNKGINSLYSQFPSLKIFAMPDLIPFIYDREIFPFYPVVDCQQHEEDERPNTPLLVGHSPSRHTRFGQKGTEFILNVLQKHEIKYDLITGLDYATALQRKSQLDVFVDQISYEKFDSLSWSGGIGKSGLEAMALGCAVVTSGYLADTEPFMPIPPIVFVDRTNFENRMVSLMSNPEEIAHLSNAGRDWIQKYATPKVAIDFLIEHSGVNSLPAEKPLSTSSSI